MWVPAGYSLVPGHQQDRHMGKGKERAQSLSLLKHFKTSLPEGVEGVGSPDVRAQHVKGALLVAILGGRERRLLAGRHTALSGPRHSPAQPLPLPAVEVSWLCTWAPPLPSESTFTATQSPLAHCKSAPGRQGVTQFQPWGDKAVGSMEWTTRRLSSDSSPVLPPHHPQPPRPTKVQRAG